MGIINTTPDSFSDGGAFLDVNAAIAHGLQLIEEGADILDIGGESTRPGAEFISIDDEITRVIPVIEALAGKTDIPLSIDTRKPEVARAAIEVGARIWNDVSALTFSAESIDVAAELECDLVLMHAQGTPQTMQDDPIYDNVVEDVAAYLTMRIEACLAAGIARHKIMIDPGIGFGKTLEHNLALMRNLGRLAKTAPVLLGASRKRFIAAIDDHKGAQAAGDRVGGSLAAAINGADGGAAILRVHDVAATRQALNVWRALKN